MIYPKKTQDPSAEEFLESFEWTADGFRSHLGSVSGTTYLGATAAGGEGDRMDLDGDGSFDATFDKKCQFFFQIQSGKPIAVEVDREVMLWMEGREYSLSPFEPIYLD